MPKYKDPPSYLSGYFPYFSDELAEIITKKLTQDELRQFHKEIKEAVEDNEKRLFKHLLGMKQQERNKYIKEHAEDTEKLSS